MQPDPTRGHVLFAEPNISSPDGRRLRAVSGACNLACRLDFGTDGCCLELVRDAFTESGFLADDRRPLQVRSRRSFHIQLTYILVSIATLHPPQHDLSMPGQRRAARRTPFSFAAFPSVLPHDTGRCVRWEAGTGWGLRTRPSTIAGWSMTGHGAGPSHLLQDGDKEVDLNLSL